MKGGQIMGQVSHLYDLFQPKHYQIYLDINREKKTFTGVTKISGNASQKEIALHVSHHPLLDQFSDSNLWMENFSWQYGMAEQTAHMVTHCKGTGGISVQNRDYRARHGLLLHSIYGFTFVYSH